MNSKLLILFVIQVLLQKAYATDLDSQLMGYSEKHRQNRSMMITAQPVGMGPVATLSKGFNLGFFLDPNSLINIEYQEANSPFGFFGDWIGKTDLNLKEIGVSYKEFVADTFYLKVGGGYRKLNYQYDGYSEFMKFEGSAVVLTAALGNQWQWNGFTLGCDWVGIEAPIMKQIDSESRTGSSSSQANLEDKEDRYLKEVTLNLVHFYLGMSF